MSSSVVVLTWIPDGYYTGSDYAARNMCHLVRGMETFSIDQFFDRFYNPAMVQAGVLGYKVQAPRLDQVLATSPPPYVEILSPRLADDGALLDEDGAPLPSSQELTVVVRALDTGGGIKEIGLYQNGKRLDDATAEDVPCDQENMTIRVFPVTLVAGDNLFTAVAYSDEMIRSELYEVVVPSGQPDVKPDLYLLVVGINVHKNAEFNLRVARSDADAFRDGLTRRGESIFAADHVSVLHDEQATRTAILAALDEVGAQAQPKDVFALYFAGHGVMMPDTNRFYLATHEVSRTDAEPGAGSIVTEGITDEELKGALQRIRALKQVVFLDACHSGVADLVAQAMGASDEVVIKKLSRAAGTWVFTAADKQQYAVEDTELGHGLFTYALIEGMDGDADTGARDGFVKLSELQPYVVETVEKLAGDLGREQFPQVYKGGDDFPIAVARR